MNKFLLPMSDLGLSRILYTCCDVSVIVKKEKA